MKDLKDTLIKESKTKPQDIEHYGKAWIGEWSSTYCGNIIDWFLKGVQKGMEKYPNDDPKFQKRCMDFIEKTLKDLNKEIY